MLRLNRLSFLLLACCSCFFSTAQTTNCNADFNYSVVNNNAVNFYAKDTLGTTHHWLFGDGSPAIVSGNGLVTHLYVQPGKYEVKHFIEKPNSSCRDSIVKIITVEWTDQCTALFNYQKIPGTLSYRFYNNSVTATGIKKSHWSFGDGGTGDSLSPVHTFAKPGVYNVCLQLETNSGCTSEHCISLQIADSSGICMLVTGYRYYRDSINCRKIYFSNTSSTATANIHFTWSFGDGTSSHDINPAHIYSQPGVYRVCLVSEADSNCRREYCDSVIVRCETSCNISAAWQYYKDSVDCKKVHFINQSISASSNIHYTWSFGDGTSSHDINPAHIYSQPGVYRVCLVSEADSNCRREFCDSVIVKCETSCNISAAWQYYKDSVDCKKVHFINQSPATGSSIHFTWSFGDGTSSHDINPAHIYNQPGRYLVCLVSEAGSNCRREFCDSITVNCANTCNLSTRFETRYDASAWATVYFNNVSAPVNNIWQTYWSYGDGASSRDYNSLHTYAAPGLYQVCLKVIGLNGCTGNYCDTVRIVKPDSCGGKANFHHDSSTVSLVVNFEASYKNTAAKYYWNFGDGMAGQGRNTSHVYSKPGKYNVCLTVKDDQCSVEHCEGITVASANGSGRVMLFPNPAVNTVSLDVMLSNPGQVSIRLLDGSGAVKAVYSKNGLTGSNRFTLPVEKLSQGIYLVEIRTGNGISFSRFMKG